MYSIYYFIDFYSLCILSSFANCMLPNKNQGPTMHCLIDLPLMLIFAVYHS